jgi:RNA polymerase sigma factor (TIGR02999 family)
MSPTPRPADVTALLREWRAGDAEALDRLIPLVYAELRKLARAHLRREGAGHSLQATALVHEIFIRLTNVDRMNIEDRAHFMAIAARLMRQILVDHARRKRAGKRGAATVVSIEVVSPQAARLNPASVDVMALDEALDELASFDPRQCRVVELRFFAGLTGEETAHVLDVSAATVERDWAMARAWLYQRLRSGSAGSRSNH